jgi:hypothetical protein
VGGAALGSPGFPGGSFANPGSVLLDGDDDHVQLGARNLPTVPGAKTLSLWFWTTEDTAATQRKTLLAVENLTAESSVQIGIEFGAMAVWTWASASAFLIAPTDASLGQWHHVAYTFDGQTHVLYADGARVGSNGTLRLKNASTTEVFLGTYHPTLMPIERFGGRIDDVRIYDRALGAAQIAALAAGGP